MEDAFLRAESFSAAPVGMLAEAAYDTAGDYQGGHAKLGYKFSPAWSVTAGYWYRDLNYSTSQAQVQSWQLATDYGILVHPVEGRKLTFRLSVWGDYADKVSKSGTSQLHGTTFTDVSLARPSDTQVQADLIYTGQPWINHFVTGFVSAGYSWVSAGDLTAGVQQGNCQYNLRVSSNDMASATLAQPCRIGRAVVNNASFSVNASQYGMQPSQDFNYGAAFVGLGGSWRWQRSGFSVTLAYHFQYLFRDLEDRLAAYGAPKAQFNQTVGLELSYAPVRQLEFFVRGQGFQNSLIGYVPMLYNPVTAKKLDKEYGLVTVGIRLALW